ncbi:shikimate kinase [Bartonella sp. DGB1]|uniref:shikimate kinase n=1 Tax=Bartonella sp. DGB1 TaxID=3239807 RepID=UPI003524ABE0
MKQIEISKIDKYSKEVLHKQLKNHSIVLVGMMGVGKTTIGKLLAKLLEIPFKDSDKEIEMISRFSVAEIFQKYGEEEFRRIENLVIQRLLKEKPIILSIGGGAFINPIIRNHITKNAISICLEADKNILLQRIALRPTRPLLNAENPTLIFETLLQQRNPIYQTADIRINTNSQNTKIITETLLIKLQQYITKINLG